MCGYPREAVTAIVFVVALISFACGGPSTNVSPHPMPAPRDAALQAFTALKNCDEAAVLSSFQSTPPQRDLLKSIVIFAHACYAFRDAFVAAYGADAWTTFQDPNHDPGDGNAQLKMIGDAEIAQLKKADIEEKANEAFCDAGETHRLRMVKVDGGWLVDADCFAPAGADPSKMSELMRAMAAQVEKYQKAIGKPGVKPDDIDSELGRAMLKSMSGFSTDKPHRFDIDKM